MFSWRAGMIAARSRAFIAGSGWPSLAATVISRASLLNSFDFWASCRPLRCMMFLNWECSAMRFLLGFVRNGWIGGWKARRQGPLIIFALNILKSSWVQDTRGFTALLLRAIARGQR